jgi:GAF domain-containing protein
MAAGPDQFECQGAHGLELVFQDGRVMSPAEAGYPEARQSLPLDNKHFSCFDQPATVQHIVDPQAAILEDKRAHLLALGVKRVLVIPLISRGQANGRLTFRFTEERDFRPEELEIARALASHSSDAIGKNIGAELDIRST